MRLAPHRLDDLVRAVRQPILDARLQLLAEGLPPHLDPIIASIEHDVWRRVASVLELHDDSGRVGPVADLAATWERLARRVHLDRVRLRDQLRRHQPDTPPGKVDKENP